MEINRKTDSQPARQMDTASKTNKSKLDRVQSMGLRTILGAMRSTPIQQMEKTADLQPLECRHEYKAAIQGGKLKRLTSHPLHQKLQHGTKNRLKRKIFKHKLKDLQKENADLLEADPGKCEELTLGNTEVTSRSQKWNFRPWGKGNTGSRTSESTHTGDDTRSLS